MPVITQAAMGFVSLVPSTDRDTSGVAKGAIDLKLFVSTVEWSDEQSWNDASSVGTGPRRYSQGKTSATVTINGFPSDDATGLTGAIRSATGALNKDAMDLYVEYGPAGTDRVLQAIIGIESSREGLDPEGNAVIETSWRSLGDEEPLVIAT